MRNLFPSLVAVMLALAGNLLHAADEKFPQLKIGDDIYTNVLVTSKTATDIFILHKGGVANFKLKNLSPELQKQFGFDPEKAATQEKTQAEADAAYKANLRSAETVETENTNSTVAVDSQKEIWAKRFLNEKAPEIVIEKWLSAKPETDGKFLLVDFWATWCGPCRKAIPELNQLHQKFGKKLVVIGLSDEPEEKVRAMTDPPIEYFSAIDTAGTTKKILEVRGIPHVLIIDPKGIVRWEGFPLLDGHELTEQVVQDILTKYSK
jgi:cytochrome c biogenesis protein CcmG/thiol:disulfide interchange protein DsbE